MTDSINFNCYVAIGDSITSGYTDGALFYEGQQVSFANLLAEQFKKQGGGSFKQPLITKGSVGIGFYGNSKLISNQQNGVDAPKYVAPQGDLSAFAENIFAQQGPFNNMSVPSAKLTHLVIPGMGNPANGMGNFNPFFTRMASNPQTASILSDTIALKPTFFTLFIGNNDILTYASTGGTMDKITPIEGEVGVGFTKTLNAVTEALLNSGAKGAIANLADISSAPYFTAIPYNGLYLNSAEVIKLNAQYEKQQLVFQEGKNAFIIEDKTDPHGMRPIKQGELIILEIQLDPLKDAYLSGEIPIPKKYMLSLSELAVITKALTSYNDEIKRIAKEKGLAFVDVHAYTKTLNAEITYNPIARCATYHTHRIFSLDGLHLNTLGQARLANLFIHAINKTFKTHIEQVVLA